MKRLLFRAAPALAALVLFTAALFTASCTSQPVVLPSRDFDRPTDMTFVCLGAYSPAGGNADAGAATADGGATGAAGPLVVTGQAMRQCHPRGDVDPTPGSAANNYSRTFAFVTNSSSGDLTVIDADKWSLVNLDPENPSFNRLPLGVLPTQLASSDDGCRLVTANHGSCDLSFVDPAALLTPTLAREMPAGTTLAATPGATVAKNVVPTTKSGRPLNLLAGEISFLPQDPATGAALCDDQPSRQWQALVTFPSCDLVALIDLPSGVINKAAYVRRSSGGVSLVPLADGEEPSCTADCRVTANGADASVAEAGATAAGATDGGQGQGAAASAAIPGGPPYVGPGALRPSALAIVPETGRAFVGLANAAYVVAFDVATNSLDLATASVIPLHEDALGVNRVRLSIDPYKDKIKGGRPGTFIGNDTYSDREYLYVIARDGSLRVVQVATQPENECETNVDFGAPNAPATTTTCPVIGTAPRRPGAIGPGLRLPTPAVDVAVADVRPTPDDKSETSVSGAHAWVLTANGSVFLVNLDPVLRNIFWVDGPPTPVVHACTDPTNCKTEPAVAPNTVRNRNFLGYTVSLDPSSGLPRLDVPPSQPVIGPRIEPIWTQGSAKNTTALSPDYNQTYVDFPDQGAVIPQTWNVTWEGALMGSPRFSGQIQAVQDTSSSLKDLGMDFCRTGVLTKDIATLVGCTNTNQCGIGKQCVFGSNGALGAGGLAITGLCLAPDPMKDPATTCEALLSTVRRYEVTSTSRQELGLTPLKDELVRPSSLPCVPTPVTSDGGVDGSADARDGAAGDASHDAAAEAGGDASGGASALPANDCFDPLDPTTAKFQCIAGRCLYPCSTPFDTGHCRAGRICVSFSHKNDCSDGQCFCADAPDLTKFETHTPDCLGELLPYQVNTGRSFLVSGSQTALPTTRMADANGACVPLPGLDERSRVRISIDEPVCTNVATTPQAQALDSRCDPTRCAGGDTVAAQLEDILTTDQADPCMFVGGPNESDPTNTSPHHLRTVFRNREVRFMMTNLERPPSTVFQLRFDVHGGFQPQTVAIPGTVEVTMPARLMLGPFDANPQTTAPVMGHEVPYLFVVDQRRLGRSQGGGPTRGQLLRIHPRGFVITSPTSGAQPWFEDLNHSQNLFPIQ